MNLYLANTEDIYFPKVKEYVKEIISSYDNGNYRSAMVMLYATVVCDLFLKLKELSEVYSDDKATRILKEIDEKRQKPKDSSWERELIEKIHTQTELLNTEIYYMISHIYDLRNFSAHPALTADYELVSPQPDIVVGYIKVALNEIFTKPPIFAQNIVGHMTESIAAKKDIYRGDDKAFEKYLHKAYLERMSDKVRCKVFKAFWKFTFIQTEGDVIKDNRSINRRTLEVMLRLYGESMCAYVRENPAYFQVAQNERCLGHVCILLAQFPQVYSCLTEDVRVQISRENNSNAKAIMWFVDGNLEEHLLNFDLLGDVITRKTLELIKRVCVQQGQPALFPQFLLHFYSLSNTYNSARNRFDNIVAPFIGEFSLETLTKLVEIINQNDQIYGYFGQQQRNDQVVEAILKQNPQGINFEEYPHFAYSEPTIREEDANTTDDRENKEDVEVEEL